jgi:hypothetical protein
MPPPDDQRRTFLGAVAAAYRGIFAVFDFGKSTAMRLFNLMIGGLALAIGGALMFYARDIVTFFFWDARWPWLYRALEWIWMVSFGIGAISALQGAAMMFEALRFSIAPKTADVHGSARPAAEQEARLAARGKPQARDFNDQRFPD